MLSAWSSISADVSEGWSPKYAIAGRTRLLRPRGAHRGPRAPRLRCARSRVGRLPQAVAQRRVAARIHFDDIRACRNPRAAGAQAAQDPIERRNDRQFAPTAPMISPLRTRLAMRRSVVNRPAAGAWTKRSRPAPPSAGDSAPNDCVGPVRDDCAEMVSPRGLDRYVDVAAGDEPGAEADGRQRSGAQVVALRSACASAHRRAPRRPAPARR